MQYKRIASPADLLDWLLEIGEPEPDNIKGVDYPFVMPYEVIRPKNAEPAYQLGVPVPLIAFDLDDVANEMLSLKIWYAGFSERGMPIDEYNLLLKARNRMAEGLAMYGKLLAEVEEEESKALYRRNVRFNRLKGIYRGKVDNANIAEANALADCEPEYREVRELRKLITEMREARDSYKQTLNAMSGVRSTIADELKTPKPE